MTSEKVVTTFARIARPIMREWMTPNSCIGSARVTIETMKIFDLRAVEIPVCYALQIPALKYARISGFSDEEREDMKARTANWRDELCPDGLGWNGHLLALVEGRWLLDPSIDQAAAPDFGVEIEEEVFVIDTAAKQWDYREDFEMQLGIRLSSGHEGMLMYRKICDTSYRDSGAWTDEGLPFLAAAIATQMVVSEMWAGQGKDQKSS